MLSGLYEALTSHVRFTPSPNLLRGSGIVLHKEQSDRHEKESNARIAAATERTTATAPSKRLRLRG